MSLKIATSFHIFYLDYIKLCGAIQHSSSLQNAQQLYLAVLSAEDKYFLDHKGVSLKSIIRAFIKRHGGASTIDMQLVRTITNRREITIRRKIREMLLALCIESRFTKKQILDCYLEKAYFGYKINGVNDVLGKLLKGKKQSELSVTENCFIAALLKRPYNPFKYVQWKKAIDNRINYILNQYKFNEKKLSLKIKTML